jgi:hypothetical protein
MTKFTDEQLREIRDHLDEKYPQPRTCPVCRHEREMWLLTSAPVYMPVMTRDDVLVDDSGRIRGLMLFPSVALVCSYCSNMLFFSTGHMGLTPMGVFLGTESDE